MDRQFYYVAIELCAGTLEDFISAENSNFKNEDSDKMNVMRSLKYRWTDKKLLLEQITKGVEYLHNVFKCSMF